MSEKSTIKKLTVSMAQYHSKTRNKILLIKAYPF